jgi:hypothetical protein
MLRDLKARGLGAPKLTIADGHLGIWSAVAQVWPESAEQRCWNHRLRNILDAVPDKAVPEVTAHLQRLANADRRAVAERERRRFRAVYATRYPKAVERLEHDWERMVAYDAFPQDHWRHLRTTNVVESPFDAVRLRTAAAKRFKKVENATALIWRLLLVVEQHFRKLNAPPLCADVFAGVACRDGVRVGTAKSTASLEHAEQVAARRCVYTPIDETSRREVHCGTAFQPPRRQVLAREPVGESEIGGELWHRPRPKAGSGPTMTERRTVGRRRTYGTALPNLVARARCNVTPDKCNITGMLRSPPDSRARALSAGRAIVRLVGLLSGLGLPPRLLEPSIQRRPRYAQPPRRRRLGLAIPQQRLRPRWPSRPTRTPGAEGPQELERPLAVLGRQHPRSLRIDEQSAHGPLEFPNVVRPLRGGQRFHERGIHRWAPPTPVATHRGIAPNELHHEQRDVRSSLPERWDAHTERRQPRIQVREERTLLGELGKREIARRDQPDVDSNRPIRPDRPYLLPLDRHQELSLYSRRGLTDLIQEERSAGR